MILSLSLCLSACALILTNLQCPYLFALKQTHTHTLARTLAHTHVCMHSLNLSRCWYRSVLLFLAFTHLHTLPYVRSVTLVVTLCRHMCETQSPEVFFFFPSFLADKYTRREKRHTYTYTNASDWNRTSTDGSDFLDISTDFGMGQLTDRWISTIEQEKMFFNWACERLETGGFFQRKFTWNSGQKWIPIAITNQHTSHELDTTKVT